MRSMRPAAPLLVAITLAAGGASCRGTGSATETKLDPKAAQSRARHADADCPSTQLAAEAPCCAEGPSDETTDGHAPGDTGACGRPGPAARSR